MCRRKKQSRRFCDYIQNLRKLRDCASSMKSWQLHIARHHLHASEARFSEQHAVKQQGVGTRRSPKGLSPKSNTSRGSSPKGFSPNGRPQSHITSVSASSRNNRLRPSPNAPPRPFGTTPSPITTQRSSSGGSPRHPASSAGGSARSAPGTSRTSLLARQTAKDDESAEQLVQQRKILKRIQAYRNSVQSSEISQVSVIINTVLQ
jgi:hypothetical protein